MVYRKTIIVGGGPSGSSCARVLKNAGMDVLILEKATFPRNKICAGWITTDVMKILSAKKEDYPYSLTNFDKLCYRFAGWKFDIKTTQFAIRRIEFDKWLLERSGADIITHKVDKIQIIDGKYIIDDKYQCDFLIGAGGTNCPVYKSLFGTALRRNEKNFIAALEAEFQTDIKDKNCYLYFLEDKLPGYFWYVPKMNGYVNIGLGGKFLAMKKRNKNLLEHWKYFVDKLKRLDLVDARDVKPKGHNYYLNSGQRNYRIGNAFIVGDSAGLSTLDMGEGIGPSIKSGMLCAEAVLKDKDLKFSSIKRFSFPDIIFK